VSRNSEDNDIFCIESIKSVNFKINIGDILFTVYLDKGFFKPVMEKVSYSHSHGLHEVHFMLKGNDIMQVGSENINLKNNSFCVVFPNVYHTQKNVSKKIIEKCCFSFKYEILKSNKVTSVTEEMKEIVSILDDNEMQYIYSEGTCNISSLILEILHECKVCSFFYYSKIQFLVAQFLIDLFRIIVIKKYNKYHTQYNIKQIHIEQDCFEDKRIYIIQQFFDENFHYKVKAEDLAGNLHISKRQLDRILKQLFNMSFMQKLMETRIEVSKDILKNTNLPIWKISEQVGYESVNGFCSAFRKVTGLTPSEYRLK